MKDIKFGTLIIKLSAIVLLVFAGGAKSIADDKNDPARDPGKSALAHARHHHPCRIMKDGSAELNMNGVPGRTYTVQASTNMTGWLNIGTVTADSKGICQFMDVNALNFPQRFYRLMYP